MKKILLFIFLVFTFCFVSDANALRDAPRPQTYSRKVEKDKDGKQYAHWICDVAKLNPLPYWAGPGEFYTTAANWLDTASLWSGVGVQGDMSFEYYNQLCVSYAALYSLAMVASLQAGESTTTVVGIAATATLLTGTSLIYYKAHQTFDNIRVCGDNWLVWGHHSGSADIFENYPTKDAFEGSYKRIVDSCITDISSCPKNVRDSMQGRNYFNIEDQVYREYIYQGMEFIHSGCKDPRDRAERGFDGNEQRYYMRGYDPANFACDRFLKSTTGEKNALKTAYKCCVEASKNSICIAYKVDGINMQEKLNRSTTATSFFTDRNIIKGHRYAQLCKYSDIPGLERKNFLAKWDYLKSYLSDVWHDTSNQYIGNFCYFEDVTYVPYRGNEPNKICIKTWSLCPYNHNIAGGTEIVQDFYEEFDENNLVVSGECINNDQTPKSCNAQVKNFCQLNRHCTISIPWNDVTDRTPLITSPYFDKACLNFVGSSLNTRNFASYGGYTFLKESLEGYKVFTAPLAECFNESIKNFLFNKAGHTRCKNSVLKPDANEVCEDGEYLYKKGDDLGDPSASMYYMSPILKLQRAIRGIIKAFVIFAISLFGMKTIMAKSISKKVLMNLLVKITIILAFAYSSWWYNEMFRFVYALSNSFSTITENIGFEQNDIGFVKNTISDLVSTKTFSNNDGCYFKELKKYGDRTYISMFDTLDCKLAKYLGYGTGNIPSLLATVFIFENIYGALLIIGTILIILLLILFTLKAVYIFIVAGIALAIMLFVSPIIIPLILFEKTKGIFDAWLKNIISFALQPMVLFAYVTISLMLLDKYFYGEALFTGQAPKKQVVCSKYCRRPETGEIVTMYSDPQANTQECTEEGNELVVISDNSFICSVENLKSNFGRKWTPFGISIIGSNSFNMNGFIAFLKVLFLIFILSRIMDTIATVAASLTGGKQLPGVKMGANEIFGKVWAGLKFVWGLGGNVADRLGQIIRPEEKQGTREKETKREGARPDVVRSENESSGGARPDVGGEEKQPGVGGITESDKLVKNE